MTKATTTKEPSSCSTKGTEAKDAAAAAVSDKRSESNAQKGKEVKKEAAAASPPPPPPPPSKEPPTVAAETKPKSGGKDPKSSTTTTTTTTTEKEATTAKETKKKKSKPTTPSDPNAPFVTGQQFSTIEELIAAVEHHSHQQGFQFAKSFTYVSGGNTTTTRIVQRGKFKCKKQTNDNDDQTKIKCGFLLSFTGKVERGAQHPAFYVIRNVCLDHDGHTLHPAYVKKSNDESSSHIKHDPQELTPDELEVIRKLVREPTTTIVTKLCENFGPNYSPALISTMQSEISQQIFGNNRQGLQKFLEFGRRQSVFGGKFLVSHKYDLSFSCAAYQNADMVQLHAAYNDHVIQDGILAIPNVFGISLLPTMVVDALGKVVLSSVILVGMDDSGDDLIHIMNDLGLMRPNATYTTIRSPRFSLIANKFSLHHRIRSHEFLGAIKKDTNMDAKTREELQTDCSKCLTMMDDAAELDSELKALQSKYNASQNKEAPAMTYIKALEENKTKMAIAYIGKVFHCSGALSRKEQPSLANNVVGHQIHSSSIVKEHVTLTKEQKKQNLFETAIDLQTTHFSTYKQKASKEIGALIKKGAKWSTFVDNAWKAEALHALVYTCKRIINGEQQQQQQQRKYEVVPSSSDEDKKEQIQTVTVVSSDDNERSNSGVPECTCVHFQSTLIPCRHICRALSFEKESEIFHVKHLKHRWRLEGHPFYAEAAEKLGILQEDDESPSLPKNASSERATGEEPSNITAPLLKYDEIDVPTTPDAQSTKLKSMVEQIASECKTSSHKFKVACLSLDSLLQKLQSTTNADDLVDNTSKPPAKRKVDSSAASSNLEKSKSGKKRKGTVCV